MSGEDPTLVVPELPALQRGLGSLEFPLRRECAPEDDRPFTLTGARLRITGGRARGVEAVRTPGGRILSRLRLDGSHPAGSVRTPLGLERRLRAHGNGTEVVERLVASPSEPVLFVEWEARPGTTLDLDWVLPAPAPVARGAVRWRRVERGLIAVAGGTRTLVALSEYPGELTVRPMFTDEGGPALRVRASMVVPSAGTVRLAVAGIGPDDDATRVLRVMGRNHVAVPAARAVAARVLEERLVVEGPDEALGPAVSWAAIRLAGLSGGDWRPRDGMGERELQAALASLALGDAEPGRQLVAAAPVRADGRDPDESARYLLLVSRYLAWTGDRGTVQAAWDEIRAHAARCMEAARARPERRAPGTVAGSRRGEDAALRARALGELVGVAEDVGDPRLAASLRSCGEAAPPGTDAAGIPVAVPGEGAVVEAVVSGLLGAEPDAARGRLVLRPRMPRGWDRLVVRNLVVGAASVDLEYGRSTDSHRFTLGQRRGGPPLQVVFEPELAGHTLVAARVDGADAELDAVAVDGHLRVSVQLVLDQDRTVEVEIRGGGD